MGNIHRPMGAACVGINPAARIGYTCILEQPLIHDGCAWRNRACFQTCQCSNHLEGGAGCLFLLQRTVDQWGVAVLQ